jgi:hypothetical protein
MEITRNVTEIKPADRNALEHVLGQPLHDGQQLIVRIVTPEAAAPHADANTPARDEDTLPDWCNVYEGLSDAEVAAIEEVMLTRANLTRPSE